MIIVTIIIDSSIIVIVVISSSIINVIIIKTTRSGSLNKRNSFLNLNKPTAASPALGKSPSKSFSKPEITYDRSECWPILMMLTRVDLLNMSM